MNDQTRVLGVAPQQPAEAVASDQIIQVAEALQVRRILEEIKRVAALHPADDMPTPFQSAWALCCEEIFYRATGEQWHMDEDTPQERAAQQLAVTVCRHCGKPALYPDWSRIDRQHGWRFVRGTKEYHCREAAVDIL